MEHDASLKNLSWHTKKSFYDIVFKSLPRTTPSFNCLYDLSKISSNYDLTIAKKIRSLRRHSANRYEQKSSSGGPTGAIRRPAASTKLISCLYIRMTTIYQKRYFENSPHYKHLETPAKHLNQSNLDLLSYLLYISFQ